MQRSLAMKPTVALVEPNPRAEASPPPQHSEPTAGTGISKPRPVKLILRPTKRNRRLETLNRRLLNALKKIDELRRDFHTEFGVETYMVIRAAGKYMLYDST